MTRLDWIAIGLIALTALAGLRKGMVSSGLSAIGIVAGAIIGARVAPQFFAGDGSPYTPLVGLLGALVGALIFETIGSVVGRQVRGALRFGPLRAVDSAGGLVIGALVGVVFVWVLGAVALYTQDQRELRQAVQRSLVLQRLNEVAPPNRLMEAIERVDPFPAIVGPRPPTEPPDPRLTRDPETRRAAESVVRVVGTACGLAMTGSGWVARPSLIVTNAHVIAGQRDTSVEVPGRRGRLSARAVAFDARNDVAVLRVRGLDRRPLPIGGGESGASVAILGYPGGGPLRATAGRIGDTVPIVAPDAYGRGRTQRPVTTFSGQIRRGNSGGPAVNGRGEVETTVFAARLGNGGGFGVPSAIVRRALAGASEPVSTGPCAR